MTLRTRLDRLAGKANQSTEGVDRIVRQIIGPEDPSKVLMEIVEWDRT